MDDLTVGQVLDMFTESANDNCSYTTVATQEDFDRWAGRRRRDGRTDAAGVHID